MYICPEANMRPLCSQVDCYHAKEHRRNYICDPCDYRTCEALRCAPVQDYDVAFLQEHFEELWIVNIFKQGGSNEHSSTKRGDI